LLGRVTDHRRPPQAGLLWQRPLDHGGRRLGCGRGWPLSQQTGKL